MTSSGTVPLKDIWSMLDNCAQGYTAREGKHRWIIEYKDKSYLGLPFGPHGRRVNPGNRFSQNLCSALRAPWRCDGDPEGLRESDLVVKPGADAGGVLCCLD